MIHLLLWAHGNRIQGIGCSVEIPDPFAPKPRRARKAKCSGCGGLGAELLCDGPGERKRRTCDKDFCEHCAVGLRAWDKDFCLEHAEGQHPDVGGGCAAGNATRVRCQGAIIELYTEEEWAEWGRLYAETGTTRALEEILGPRVPAICLHHAVFLDEWLTDPGMREVWEGGGWPDARISDEEIWGRFRGWMNELSTSKMDEVMRERRLR